MEQARVDVDLDDDGDGRERLYHYTSMSGLTGIIEKGVIWASDARYMNDATERRYARDLIDRVTFETLDELAPPEILERVHRYEGMNDPFVAGIDPYIICFCENGDLLSQWRAYSDAASGVSIGFDRDDIRWICESWPNLSLFKIVYEEAEQVAAVRSVVCDWIELVQELVASGEEWSALFPLPALELLRAQLSEFHITFKHPGFVEEQEWRLVLGANAKADAMQAGVALRNEIAARSLMEMGVDERRAKAPELSVPGETNLEIKTRPTAFGLTPFVEVPLLSDSGHMQGRLPIVDVKHGPALQPDLTRHALRLLLDRNGYMRVFVPVTSSKTPLRSSV